MPTIFKFLWMGFILAHTIDSLRAQAPTFKPHYVNMTEVGGLFGRVVYDVPGSVPATQQVENRLSLTIQTFNGIQLKPRLALGVSCGVDWYQAVLLAPVAAGVRYDLARSKKNVTLLGLFDAGYSSNWLHVDATDYKTQGGMMLNPGLGLKFGFKSGSALVLSLSYKRQNAKVTKPLNWGEIEKWEDRVYNRMALRLGMMF
ncbi:hypothetical protein [Runella zeae]|jgi:hypothetical protein|uniref:hypothetical protein n=1 Tax=Runella zeae TaxID=94255 RepID=UPI002356447E|nr:hypothetical protein [Runella zeae]